MKEIDPLFSGNNTEIIGCHNTLSSEYQLQFEKNLCICLDIEVACITPLQWS